MCVFVPVCACVCASDQAFQAAVKVCPLQTVIQQEAETNAKKNEGGEKEK